MKLANKGLDVMHALVTYTTINVICIKVHSHLMLSANLGAILGGTQCKLGDCLILKVNVNLT